VDIKFDEVKAQFPILSVCDMLGLELKPEQGGRFYRGDCPFCQKARTFRVTPNAELWGCFHCRDAGEKVCRGDQIALVQKLKSFKSAKEAAQWLIGDENQRVGGNSSRNQRSESGQDDLRVDCDHDDVALLGFDTADAKRLGIGVGLDGELKGHVVIPLRLGDGSLAGHLAVIDCVLPESFQLPAEKIVPLRPKRAS